MGKNQIKPEDEKRIMEDLCVEFRKSDSNAAIVRKGLHKKLCYRGSVFLVKIATDEHPKKDLWFFGIGVDLMPFFDSQWAGALLICAKRDLKYRVLCLSGKRVKTLVAGANSYIGKEDKRGLSSNDWNELMGPAAVSDFTLETFQARYREKRDQGHPQYKLYIHPRGVNCEIEVTGIGYRMPDEWWNKTDIAARLDLIIQRAGANHS